MSQAEVVSALRVIGPMTSKELQKYLGLAPSSVNESLRLLRGSGSVCISRWEHPKWTGSYAPVYGLGKVDEPHPPRATPSEVSKRVRVRNKTLMAARESKRVASPWDALLKGAV